MTGFAFFLVTLCVAWAAICDVRTLKIPNSLHIIMLGLVPFAFLIDPSFQTAMRADFWLRVGLSIGLLGVGFGLFAKGWLGGGDAKLLAGLGLWVGTQDVVMWLMAITIYGAGLGAFLLIISRLPLPVWLEGAGIGKGLRLGQPRMPYALPIALATITVLAMTQKGIW